jgi:hypothetical protein
MSLIEKIAETSIAFLLSVLLAPLFFSINGIESSVGQNINVVLCFTALAIARGYVIRRVFNRFQFRNKEQTNV